MEFRGTVAAVKEPQTKTVTVNGEDRDVTRLRVVAESGLPRPREQADGSMRNERDKSYFDVEGWGPKARALARVNIGEKFNVSGDILEAQPFEKADGTTFYPSHQLRVNNVEFIGVNQAASRDRAASAVAGVRAANDKVVAESMDADLSAGPEARQNEAEAASIGF